MLAEVSPTERACYFAGRMQSAVTRDLGLGKSGGMPGAVTLFAAFDARGDSEVEVEELFEEVLAR